MLRFLSKKGPMLSQNAARSLQAYVPSDARERGFQERMLELLEREKPFSREHFEPGHFTASAFVLSPEQDAVLLILHKKLQIWVQPGGHVEADDISLVAAARREIGEELGILLPAGLDVPIFDIDIHPISARKTDPAHEHFDVRFRFQSSTLAFVQNEEVAEARWVELRTVERVTEDESVLRAIRKLR